MLSAYPQRLLALGRVTGARRLVLARQGRVGRHSAGLAVLFGLTFWLCRHIVLTSALPAGTDMFGFVTRARQNASVAEVMSPWAPSALGAVRQFTLDNVLGALTIITGQPVVTVKLLIVSTLFAGGVSAYSLSWHWYRRRVGATLAGALFVVSQSLLTRWGSGELNVEMAMAAAPLLLLLWSKCLDRLTARRVGSFVLIAGAVMFVRVDMVLYVVPFIALQSVMRLLLSARPRLVAMNLVESVGAALVGLLLVLGCVLIPAFVGIRPQWLTTSSLFDRSDFSRLSLDLYPSLLGFGREIGYLAFTGQQTWFSHPWLPPAAYDTAATFALLLALAALWRHRGHRSLFLIASFVVGVLLAKGIRSPIGSLYLFGIQHLPVFGNLRDPNRWLIVPSLAVAVMAGLTIDHVHATATRWFRPGPFGRVFAGVGAAVLVAVVLLPVAPTVVRGLLAWRPHAAQLALLQPVAKDTSTFAVATIPYDQTYRFLTADGYRGYEHDLGAESASFTGHPALADGGWQQQTADFVAFTSGLLQRRDPAFQRLLATVGVKYLVDFAYPETAPHLLPRALFSSSHDPSTGTLWQQRAWSRIRSTNPIRATSAGGTYRLPSWSPTLSLRSNLAVVLGGAAGLAALADLPGLHLKQWAAVTAGDALAHGGLRGLLDLIRQADLVVLDGEPVSSLAVLATPALGDVAGMTDNPDLDRLTQLIPSDQSSRSGSLANEALPAAAPGLDAAAMTFRLARRRNVEVWVRAETSPTAATLRLRLDGRLVRRATPLSVLSGPMVWIRLGRYSLARGDHHLRLTTASSPFGGTYEVDELRVLDPEARTHNQAVITRAVERRRGQLAASFDVNALPLGLGTSALSRSVRLAAPPALSYWEDLDAAAVHAQRIDTRRAGRGLNLRISSGRRFYTIIQHSYDRPRDWSGRGYLFFSYQGTGTGDTYHLYVDFDRRHVHSASYDIVDTGHAWRTLALSTRRPDHGTGPFTWKHVVSIRLASDSKDMTGAITVGRLGLSRRLNLVPVNVSVPCSLTGALSVQGAGITARRRSCGIQVGVNPHRVQSVGRVIEAQPIHEKQPARISYVRRGATSYTFAIDSNAPAWLMLDQAYDPHWTMRIGNSSASATPLYSVVNGYRVPPGVHAGTVTFSGSGWVGASAALSAVSAAALLGLVFVNPRPISRRKRVRHAPARWLRRPRLGRRPRPTFWTLCVALATVAIVGPLSLLASVVVAAAIVAIYEVAWWMCLVFAAGLLAVAPVVATRSAGAANILAFDVLLLVGVAVVLVGLEERSRFTRG